MVFVSLQKQEVEKSCIIIKRRIYHLCSPILNPGLAYVTKCLVLLLFFLELESI